MRLTTDMWTSIQNLNYLCLMAYYIDSDWTYHKKILNFYGISMCPLLPGSERKLEMLSATGLSPSRMQHSTASPSSTMVAFLSHNPVLSSAQS